jgi:serine/threonine protein kinase/beta-lactam-binding protein with PASTA domain
MTSTGDPLVGHLLDGRYQVTARLARGGMATVYQAVDNRLTRVVAVKVMHIGLGDDAEFARKFDREARAAARLSHPNVVSVFDQGHDNGRPYIVMEFVQGRTLRDLITREAPLDPLRALEIIEPVLSALSAAHDAGLVHRDVKPENVLISQRGQIKVADFGLAKAISAQTSTATQGLLIGTVSYLPPELVVSGRSDARSDVYSTGVVLFEMLTGRKPHTGDTPIQVAYAHVHKDVPPPSSLPTAGPVPPYLDALIARATARESDLRPPDAKVMLTQVRRVRAALREGLTDDPDLTQDLTVTLRPLGAGRGDASRDAADYEATQLVFGNDLPRARPEPIRPRARPEPIRYAPPHMVDAPPPAVPRNHNVAPHGRESSLPLPSSPISAQRLEQDRRRLTRNRRRGWLALLLVLLLTTVAALTGWYLVDGRFTSAPALTSLSQSDAAHAADSAGLRIAFDSAYSESVSKGMVISTSPGPGAKIVDGGEISAVVSKGPERYLMPAVLGQTEAAAEAALTKANLRVGTVTGRYHESAAPGTVLFASERSGSPLKSQTGIDLVLSRGPKPIPIRDWSGKSAAEARKALQRAGFRVTRTSEHSSSVPAGRVISQTPDSGTGVAKDSVALTESLGPVMVKVPMVRAMGVQAATDVMRKAGFKVRTAKVSQNYLGVGYVAYTDPAARSKAPKGSTITLYLV